MRAHGRTSLPELLGTLPTACSCIRPAYALVDAREEREALEHLAPWLAHGFDPPTMAAVDLSGRSFRAFRHATPTRKGIDKRGQCPRLRSNFNGFMSP